MGAIESGALRLGRIGFWGLGGAAGGLRKKLQAADAAPAPQQRHHGTAIAFEGVGKRYGDRAVLENVSIDVAPGEFIALVGRSGCGKSTLLRLVAGLEALDGGAIRIDGSAPQAQAHAMRLMFQDARLLPWLRVIDNVALGLAGAQARERAKEALAQVGLADRAGDWPAVLSGGQRQRVALARALVHRPRLLLLDEPLGALDALTRIEMQQLIESLWRRHGFTAVLVTHDVAEAVALADRVLLVEDRGITFDERVPLERPRPRSSPAWAAFEDRVLQRVLRQPQAEEPAAVAEPTPWPVSALRFAV